MKTKGQLLGYALKTRDRDGKFKGAILGPNGHPILFGTPGEAYRYGRDTGEWDALPYEIRGTQADYERMTKA